MHLLTLNRQYALQGTALQQGLQQCTLVCPLCQCHSRMAHVQHLRLARAWLVNMATLPQRALSTHIDTMTL
jgi:hypothetical protein